MKPACSLFLGLLLSCLLATNARWLTQESGGTTDAGTSPSPSPAPSPQASPNATKTAGTGASLSPSPAPPSPSPSPPVAATDATKPKVNPEIEKAYLLYASSCTCGRRPFENPTYEVSIPSKTLPNGLRSSGGRQIVYAEGEWQSKCASLNTDLCRMKNVRCGKPDQFTDDAGKVIAVANDCAARIDYL